MSLGSVASIVLALGGGASVTVTQGEAGLPIVDLALSPVRTTLSAEDVVGSRRSGAICTPAGKLLWRDVAMDGGELATHAAKRLHDAGVSIAIADPDRLDPALPPSRMQVVATVERVTMRSCVPWHRLKLVASALRTSGRLVVEWRLFRVGDGRLITKVTTCRDFAVDDAPTIHAAFERAFGSAAQAVVPTLLQPSIPTMAAACTPEELPKT